jgi:hypothetical protein
MSKTSYRTQLRLLIQTVKRRSRNAKVACSIPNRGKVEFSAQPLVLIRRIILINLYCETYQTNPVYS